MAEDSFLEGPRILGIGVGLFLLVLLWSVTILFLLACSRISPGVSTSLVILAIILTASLASVPRSPVNLKGDDPSFPFEQPVSKIYDHMFILRMVLITILSTGLAVCATFLLKHCTQPVYAEPIRKMKVQ